MLAFTPIADPRGMLDFLGKFNLIRFFSPCGVYRNLQISFNTSWRPAASRVRDKDMIAFALTSRFHTHM